jgi:2-desacetyl-2-hydroxyethyl bacteriochlorophyllide A dehydrogenase
MMIHNPTAVITGQETVGFINDKVPANPGTDEMLVQTIYTLISPGTELAIFSHAHAGFSDPNHAYAKYPFRPGYAAVGRVLEVGENVTDFQKGDGVYYNGKHRNYTLLNPKNTIVLPLPEGIDPTLAPFARIAQIAASALEVSAAVPGGTVVVFGQGMVGNLVAQLFRQRGCDVIGIDLIPFRCETARKCNLRTLHVTTENLMEQVRAALGARGAATVVEATGHPQAVPTALQLTAPFGEMILLGSTRGKVELDLYDLVHSPAITVRGAHERVCRKQDGENQQRGLLRKYLDDIANGRLIVKPLLTGVVDFKDIGEAYHRLVDRPGDTLSLILEWPE